MKIPKQLQHKDFRFVLLGKGGTEKGKIPFEKGWQKKGYKFDDKKLLQHINDYKDNFGVIGGYGNLRILDIDDKKLAKDFLAKISTYTIQTGSGGMHFYFISDYDTNHVLINELGELRAKNYQVVSAPCKHPNGKFYKVINDVPITKVTGEVLEILIKPYLRENAGPALSGPSKDNKKDTSRSGLEYRKIIALLREGKSREEIYKIMEAYSKWKDGSEQYRNLTFEKAENFYLQKGGGEEVDFEVYDYKNMMEYEPEPQSWLINEQIPKGEVGLEVGKRGERKTFTALHQALCLASGQKVFGVDEVPEKKRVLFIDNEAGKEEIIKRVKSLSSVMKIKEDIDFKCSSFSGLKLNKDDKIFSKFIKIVEEFKPDLIIVDSLQRFVSFEVDRDNVAISEFFTEVIRPIIKKYGCSWLFIHHLRKTPAMNYKSIDPLDEIRGGSELVNYSRFVLSCQSAHNQPGEDNSELVVFRVLKMSNAPIPPAKVISFTSNSDTLTVSYEGEPAEVLAGEVQAANAIKEWLFEKQLAKFQTKDVKDAAEEIGYKKTLLDEGLKVLLKQKVLHKPKRGYWEVLGRDTNQIKLGELNKAREDREDHTVKKY